MKVATSGINKVVSFRGEVESLHLMNLFLASSYTNPLPGEAFEKPLS